MEGAAGLAGAHLYITNLWRREYINFAPSFENKSALNPEQACKLHDLVHAAKITMMCQSGTKGN